MEIEFKSNWEKMDHFPQYKSMGERISQSNWKKMDHFLKYKTMGEKSALSGK